MKKFYMVFAEGRNAPTTKFETIEEAEAEAERICRKERLKTFVLESKFMFELINVVKTEL
jgi:hypothetical protein